MRDYRARKNVTCHTVPPAQMRHVTAEGLDRQLKLLDLSVQRFSMAAKDLSSLGLIAFGLGQCLFNVFPGQIPRGFGFQGQSLTGAEVDHFQGKTVDIDQSARAEKTAVLQGVFQLPDVSGPFIAHEDIHDRFADPENLFLEFAAEIPAEIIDEQRDVFFAFPQGGQRNRQNFEPVIQIFSKHAFGHFLGQVNIGG